MIPWTFLGTLKSFRSLPDVILEALKERSYHWIFELSSIHMEAPMDLKDRSFGNNRSNVRLIVGLAFWKKKRERGHVCSSIVEHMLFTYETLGLISEYVENSAGGGWQDGRKFLFSKFASKNSHVMHSEYLGVCKPGEPSSEMTFAFPRPPELWEINICV